MRWVIAAGLAYLGFQVFALYTASLTDRERRAREDLARVNAELVATRELLAESSRLAERVRISRELHDLLGHHLTALSLNLEVASHRTEGEAHEHVEQARSMARLLLSDVREAVREIREDGSVDLAGPLRSLVAGVPRPRVHLSTPEPLVCDDPERAHAVLRCVQEMLTNSVRHSGAENLWIDIQRQDGELVVQARDDGRGAREILPGRGLTGMRERLERMHGKLRLDTAAGAGFTVEARLPMEV
jgi:signal transduction histidine kinase